jgi:REP element-mobilizing transposase RayT
MKFNPDIHKRKSIRLKGYDYSKAGLYFITVCVQNRECLFGQIANDKIMMNDAGQMVNQYWLDIPTHFPNAILHEHIVMPNHIHGIIELIYTNVAANGVGAENFLPLQRQNQFQKMIPHSIGSIIKGFKIGVTKWFRNNIPNQFPIDRPVWQRNYYEHIIRNQQSYETISNYIINNPAKWQEDKFYY